MLARSELNAQPKSTYSKSTPVVPLTYLLIQALKWCSPTLFPEICLPEDFHRAPSKEVHEPLKEVCSILFGEETCRKGDLEEDGW